METKRNSGLKGQQAVSPGQRPGYGDRGYRRPERAKALDGGDASYLFFCPYGAELCTNAYPGRGPGLIDYCPFRAWSGELEKPELFDLYYI